MSSFVERPWPVVAAEHRDADAKCGRAWVCMCAPCRSERAQQTALRLTPAEARTLGRLDAARWRDTWSLFDGRAQYALLDRLRDKGLIEERSQYEPGYGGNWRLTAAGAAIVKARGEDRPAWDEAREG